MHSASLVVGRFCVAMANDAAAASEVAPSRISIGDARATERLSQLVHGRGPNRATTSSSANRSRFSQMRRCAEVSSCRTLAASLSMPQLMNDVLNHSRPRALR